MAAAPTGREYRNAVILVKLKKTNVFVGKHKEQTNHKSLMTYKGPLTYKSYCRALLNKKFWGDEVVLYTVSCMWNLLITVFNSRTDQEYWIRHGAIMDRADVNLVLNGGMHYGATGRWLPFLTKWSPV